MQSENDIRPYLDDLAVLLGGEIEDTGIVAFAQDLALFTKTFSERRPYLIGVLPDTSFSGTADSLMYSDFVEFYLAYHVSPKTAYPDLLAQTNTLKSLAHRVLMYVSEHKSDPEHIWYGVQLERAAVVQLSVNQMRGYSIQFPIRKAL